MAGKTHLRRVRANTVINTTSKKQEESLIKALRRVENSVVQKFGFSVSWRQDWKLAEIVAELRSLFPDVDFNQPLPTSTMKPDGGILCIVDRTGKSYPILITERKNQGTNDLRKAEGKKKQAKGNAVERLGKNVIGLKTAMLGMGIFPFVCFGDGCDFADASSILDRVVTIAMFGNLRTIYMVPQGGTRRVPPRQLLLSRASLDRRRDVRDYAGSCYPLRSSLHRSVGGIEFLITPPTPVISTERSERRDPCIHLCRCSTSLPWRLSIAPSAFAFP